mmetsp:Transcript_30859/g.51062  ORF Transcript_30859/g.51062 Transcript_30859/m.51062 type:complete len:216 (+) Transcript_30859:178-825(+)
MSVMDRDKLSAALAAGMVLVGVYMVIAKNQRYMEACSRYAEARAVEHRDEAALAAAQQAADVAAREKLIAEEIHRSIQELALLHEALRTNGNCIAQCDCALSSLLASKPSFFVARVEKQRHMDEVLAHTIHINDLKLEKTVFQERLRMAEQALLALQQGGPHTASDDQLCMVCLDAAPQTVLVPCGHFTCHDCALRLQQCPRCRGKIDQRIRSYP